MHGNHLKKLQTKLYLNRTGVTNYSKRKTNSSLAQKVHFHK